MTIRHGDVNIGTALAPASPLKIVAGGFAPSNQPADLTAEFAEVLIMESTNPAGATLQVRRAGGDWQDYFVFPDDGIIPEGAVLRVHTGSEANDVAPTPEREHLYAQDAGGAAVRQFPAADATVRLLNADGAVLHERSFYTQVLTASEFRILRSRDGTRALVFFREGRNAIGNIPAGALELSWTFDRNIMPEEPILRRMGSDRREDTSIVFA